MNSGEDHTEEPGEETEVAATGTRAGSGRAGSGGDSLAKLAGTFAQGGDFFGQLGRLVPASQGLTDPQLKFIADYQATAAKLDGPMDDYERLYVTFPVPTFTFEPAAGHMDDTITITLTGCRERQSPPFTKLFFKDDPSGVQLMPTKTEGVYSARVPSTANTGPLTLRHLLVRGEDKPDVLTSTKDFTVQQRGGV